MGKGVADLFCYLIKNHHKINTFDYMGYFSLSSGRKIDSKEITKDIVFIGDLPTEKKTTRSILSFNKNKKSQAFIEKITQIIDHVHLLNKPDRKVVINADIDVVLFNRLTKNQGVLYLDGSAYLLLDKKVANIKDEAAKKNITFTLKEIKSDEEYHFFMNIIDSKQVDRYEDAVKLTSYYINHIVTPGRKKDESLLAHFNRLRERYELKKHAEKEFDALNSNNVNLNTKKRLKF